MADPSTAPVRRPNLFIIGAAKSGTTSVYEWLKVHPEIYMSPAKEPRYFAPDLYAGHPHDLQYGIDEARYLALFAGATDQQLIGEASPRYIYSHDAPRLIHDFEPRARIVALVRNPVEMIYSLHNQRVSEGIEEVTDFEAALAAEDDRRAGRRTVPPLTSPTMGLYRDQGRFGEQLVRWLSVFEREQVQIIVFEDLANEPAETYRQLLEFLDIDPAFKPASFAAQNPSWTPRSQVLRRLTQTGPAKWLAYRALPSILGEGAARRLARAFRYSPIYRKARPRSPLSAALRRQLETEFEPDVQRLGEIVGRDLVKLWFGRRAAVATPAAQPERSG